MLRRKQPDTERPYKAFGYPVVPAMYIIGATVILVVLFMYQTATTWPGLIIVLTGVNYIGVRFGGMVQNIFTVAKVAAMGALILGAFLLPTGGENFGHAIFEALSCGVPALISDRTPWRDLLRVIFADPSGIVVSLVNEVVERQNDDDADGVHGG